MVTRNFIEASIIGFRWEGAKYHLSVINQIIDNEIIGKPQTPTAPRLIWHLAGFYWELGATLECALQVVSAHHKLSLNRDKITWRRVEKALSNKGIQDDLADTLRNVYKSKWYNDFQTRRNAVTHWDATFVQALSAHGRVIAVGSIGQPNLVAACEGYLSNMRDLLDQAAKVLPSGPMTF